MAARLRGGGPAAETILAAKRRADRIGGAQRRTRASSRSLPGP